MRKTKYKMCLARCRSRHYRHEGLKMRVFPVILGWICLLGGIANEAPATIRAWSLDEKPRSSAPSVREEETLRKGLALVRGEAEGMILGVHSPEGRISVSFEANVAEGVKLSVAEIRFIEVPGQGALGDPLVPIVSGTTLASQPQGGYLYLKLTADTSSRPSRGEVVLWLRAEKEEKGVRIPYEILEFTLDRTQIPLIQSTIRPLFDPYPRRVSMEERLEIMKNIARMLAWDFYVRSFAGMGGSGKGDLTLTQGEEALSAYKEMVRYCIEDLGAERVRIAPKILFSKRRSLGEVYRPVNETTILSDLMSYREIMRSLLDNPRWKGKLSMRLWDEPMPAQYPEVVLIYRAARKAFPELSLELTRHPEEGLQDVADVWVVNPRWFNETQVSTAHRMGSKMWIYCNKASGIEEPLKGMRIIGWLLWRYQLDGYMFFSVNYWDEDPWKRSGKMWRGTFVYPDYSNRKVYPSLRLELFREGIEDAAILKKVEFLAQETRDEETRKLLQEFRWTYTMKERHAGSQDPKAPREALLKRIREAFSNRQGGP